MPWIPFPTIINTINYMDTITMKSSTKILTIITLMLAVAIGIPQMANAVENKAQTELITVTNYAKCARMAQLAGDIESQEMYHTLAYAYDDAYARDMVYAVGHITAWVEATSYYMNASVKTIATNTFNQHCLMENM